MNNNNMKKLIIPLGIAVLVVIGVLWYGHDSEEIMGAIATSTAFGKVASTTGEAYDVIGTRVGTTTTGVAHYLATTVGSTTYPWRIGNKVDTVTYYFRTTTASSTGAYVSFAVLASNDLNCETASTTNVNASENVVTTDQVNWYDIGMLLKDYAGSLTIPAATTTFIWNPTGSNQTETATFMNLNAKCIALSLNASSSIIHVQMVTKSNQGY